MADPTGARPGSDGVDAQRLRVGVLDLNVGVARSALLGDHRLDVTIVPSFEEMTDFVERCRPRVLVIEFDEPKTSEVAELKALHRAHPGLRTLVVSRPIADRRVTDLLKAGVGGFLFASDAPRLPSAVRELAVGGVPMSGPVSRLVLDRARRSSAKMAAVLPRSPAADTLLTPRQREILELLAKGLSYEDVGTALGLTVNTVRTHVRTIYERLGATTKIEAVMIGIELGLVEKVTFR